MQTQIVKTICGVCGICGCGMEVTVQDGKVVKVDGDKSNPETRGALCAKGWATPQIIYSPDRLQYPMKRVGERGAGKWERITWDEALDLIANRLRQIKKNYGAEAVVFHTGSGHDNTFGDLRGYLHRLANLFGTPNMTSPFYNCYGPRVLNTFMMTGAIPSPDIENTKCVTLWGINPTDSALPRGHIKIADALKRGAKLIVIDPRKTHFARKADVHLQPRPGTDGALALGFLKVMVDENLYDGPFVAEWVEGFEELKTMLRDYPLEKVESITGVPGLEIQKAARLYAGTKQACIFLGNALDQHTNCSQAIRAITTIMAISGNLDAKGGNLLILNARLAKNHVEAHDKLPAEMDKKRLGNQYLLSAFQFTKIAHEPSAIEAILSEKPYPVKAMMVVASNPMMTSPESERIKAALMKLDFLVVYDLIMSETAKLADIVLPGLTFLEETYYATYEPGTYLSPTYIGLLMLRPAVVAPLYESRSQWQFTVDLARKLGYGADFPWENIEEAIDFELKPTGITVEKLRAHPEGIKFPSPHILYLNNGDKGLHPDMYQKYKRVKFMTPTQKVEVYSKTLKDLGIDPLPVYHEPAESPLSNPSLAREYPIILTTGAKILPFIHSQLREIESLNRLMPGNVVEIHPETAQKYGVENGDNVRVATLRSSVTCKAGVTDRILPGVAQLHHGFADANANALTDMSSRDPITGSAGLKSALCNIKKA